MDALSPGGGPPGKRMPAARIRYDDRLTALREAAQEWGIRPSTPEGAVISALIGAIAETGDLSLSIGTDFAGMVESAERAAADKLKTVEAEVERLRVSLSDSAALIDRAREALSNVDKEREHLAANVARSMAGDIVKALKPQLAAEVTIRNRNRNWQGFGLAALGTLGVVMFGFVLGSWQISGPSVAESAIERCVKAPSLDTTGHAWCDLSSLPHLSLTPR